MRRYLFLIMANVLNDNITESLIMANVLHDNITESDNHGF